MSSDWKRVRFQCYVKFNVIIPDIHYRFYSSRRRTCKHPSHQPYSSNKQSEAEFKKFDTRLKYGWFHLKLYSMFQDLSQCSIETGFGMI